MTAVDTHLVLSRVSSRTTVLGPGVRAVVWVHGCPLRCAGCVAPEDLPFEGGERRETDDLAAELNALPSEVSGLTLSGGEPMAQAAALVRLVDVMRAERDWSVMSYSGFTLEHLLRHGTSAQQRLVARLDILVDGPYLARRHADLLWRGSANQRLRFLTGRHQAPAEDKSAGLEFDIAAGALTWTGVPPVPDFRAGFEEAMATAGAVLTPAVAATAPGLSTSNGTGSTSREGEHGVGQSEIHDG